MKPITKARVAPEGAAAEPSLGMLEGLLGYHLRRAQVAVFQHFSATMGDAEITPGHLGVLVIIDANPGLSQALLGKALGIDRSTIVAVIDRLEARNLVLRKASPRDRRSHALQLSPLGAQTLRRLTALVRNHERHIARNLSPREKTQLIALLQRVRR